VALIEFSKRLQELKNKNTEEEERKIINRKKKKKKNTKQNNTKFWAENIEVMSYIYIYIYIYILLPKTIRHQHALVVRE
jgi:uncharacterized membrane protein (DUF106 family)